MATSIDVVVSRPKSAKILPP